MSIKVYKGNIISSESYEKLRVIPNGYIVVEDGFIREEIGRAHVLQSRI